MVTGPGCSGCSGLLRYGLSSGRPISSTRYLSCYLSTGDIACIVLAMVSRSRATIAVNQAEKQLALGGLIVVAVGKPAVQVAPLHRLLGYVCRTQY